MAFARLAALVFVASSVHCAAYVPGSSPSGQNTTDAAALFERYVEARHHPVLQQVVNQMLLSNADGYLHSLSALDPTSGGAAPEAGETQVLNAMVAAFDARYPTLQAYLQQSDLGVEPALDEFKTYLSFSMLYSGEGRLMPMLNAGVIGVPPRALAAVVKSAIFLNALRHAPSSQASEPSASQGTAGSLGDGGLAGVNGLYLASASDIQTTSVTKFTSGATTAPASTFSGNDDYYIAPSEGSLLMPGLCGKPSNGNEPTCDESTLGQMAYVHCGEKTVRAFIGTFCPAEHTENAPKKWNPCSVPAHPGPTGPVNPHGANIDMSEGLWEVCGFSDGDSYGPNGSGATVQVSWSNQWGGTPLLAK